MPPKGAKQPLIEHLKQVEKTTGKQPPQLLEHKPAPKEFEYLWLNYMNLKGESALTYSEIQAWSDLTCNDVKPWEVDALKTLDRIFWKQINDRYSTSSN